MTHTILHADLLAYLRGNRWLVQNGYIEKAHAILCDPPYALPGGFMSKDWDAFHSPQAFEVWVVEWAGLLIDFVHPGAVGLFFGGTRTYHRLAAGLEDAGWDVTDCIMWVHAQGFPKSMDLSKALDREAGAAREVVGKSQNGYSSVSGKMQVESGYRPRDYYADADGTFDITAPATPLAARWEGYGTALKPAWESVVVCRAPRGKRTYAALAREFGTGALAIDAARIGTDIIHSNGEGAGGLQRQAHAHGIRPYVAGIPHTPTPSEHVGRWPANFALVCTCDSDDHDPTCPVAGLQDSARYFYVSKAAAWEREAGLHHRARRNVNDGRNTPIDNPFQRGDTLRLNVHPTVKPIRLAEYLARLILPPAGDAPRRLLVPFAGSGSEMIGALLAGWDVVTGIEREAEYVDLARARVGWWAQFGTYDEARKAYEKAKREPIIIPAPVGIADDKPAQLALFEEAAS